MWKLLEAMFPDELIETFYDENDNYLPEVFDKWYQDNFGESDRLENNNLSAYSFSDRFSNKYEIVFKDVRYQLLFTDTNIESEKIIKIIRDKDIEVNNILHTVRILGSYISLIKTYLEHNIYVKTLIIDLQDKKINNIINNCFSALNEDSNFTYLIEDQKIKIMR